jgi:hypothetical protein
MGGVHWPWHKYPVRDKLGRSPDLGAFRMVYPRNGRGRVWV